ncbi:MAG TPA: cytochrome c [Archangium sp.]|nr:cytochrome c [Archangium sp.]
MGTTLNRTLSLALLALSACSERQEKPPPSPGAASVFKDSAPPKPPSQQPPPAPTPTAQQQEGSEPPAADARSPEQLFSSLGCTACHAPGRAYGPVLANSRDKAPEVVAMWILDPQKVKPGTLMPSYTGRISTAEALALAQWIKAGNPK